MTFSPNQASHTKGQGARPSQIWAGMGMGTSISELDDEVEVGITSLIAASQSAGRKNLDLICPRTCLHLA